MPRFAPFTGLRYDENLAPIPEVIAPPYDVIGEIERAELAARSPYNAIHVELSVDDPEHGLDRYAHAAALFEQWISQGALRRDDVPSLYAYRMRFTTEHGEERSTVGVIGALAVDVVGGSEVLPHERTMPKPKGDRLDLLRATQINTSPIWGLSLTPGLSAAIEAAVAATPGLTATDDEGVTHELWPITEPAVVEEITTLIGKSPVVIADGHHRYETAIFYQEEQRTAQGEIPGEHDLVMALIVELSPEQLTVQAIHRVLSGLPEGFDLRGALEEFFEIRPAPDQVSELAEEMVRQGGLGLITADETLLLIPLPTVEERSEADLDSSRLDVALSALPAHELVYQHGANIVTEMARSGQVQAAFLLRPATAEQIADTAHSGRRMPPKTTFFYPKPRTGMIYRPLRP
jgi:uncharacterized protein (DUF1015 family)